MRARSGPWAVLSASVLAAAACSPGAPASAPPVPASGLHRVQASGPAADLLLSRGARLVADYGAFRIVDAKPAALEGAPADGIELRDDYLRILLSAGPIDTSVPPPEAQRAPVAGKTGRALHLVQFAGPPRADWLDALRATGGSVVSYVPNDAYLVYGDATALGRVHALAAGSPAAQWDGPYLPEHKIDPSARKAGTGAYSVQLVEDPQANEETMAVARALETRPGHAAAALGYVDLVVYAEPPAVAALAARPDVVSVQAWAEPRLLDERQDVIVAGQLAGDGPGAPGYLAWLAERGFTAAQFEASGFGVDVSDSGLDNGTVLPNHFGLYRQGDTSLESRVAYVRLEGTPSYGSTLQGCDGHGTVNAHIVAGYSALSGSAHADEGGYRYGLGVCPFVRVGSSVIFDPSFTYPDYEDLQSRAWAAGMRVSSNSWGSDTNSYTPDSQRYDALVRDAAPESAVAPSPGNQEMTIVFAAGNAGPYSYSVGSPGNAKNVITAGAAENVRAFGGFDGCGVGDADASSAMDVAFFSSRGPAADERKKPDLLAPGTHVSGGVAQADGQRAAPPANANGQAIACFVGSSVCGGVGSPYYPAGQQWYTASTGTSHSTPAIAGAAALVRQRFVNLGLAPPSPAMTKAFLVNAARYMTGAGANDTLYSSSQGMGLVDLGAAFDDVPRLLRDQEPEDLFTASGQTRTFTGSAGDPTKPFRVTLAWTDAPGTTFGAAYMNDLDLSVQIGGATYKGNVFSGATSVPGGNADARDNVESVFLPAGTVGPFTVTVTAASIGADGVPNNATPLDQDFALVVTNSCDTPPPAAPAGVTAVASAPNQITVGWTPNGASSYHVYRATAAGGPYQRVASVAGPPWVDAGRSGGTGYFYVVRAQQACAWSGQSAEATAIATGACLLEPAFAGLASAEDSHALTCGVVLGWSPAAPSCGGTISYDVYRDTTAGFTPGPANRIATGLTGITHLDSGSLVDGTTYRYVVRAVETSGATAVEDGNLVERSARPTWATLSYEDDLDGVRPPAASAWWIEEAITGGDRLEIVSGCHYQSASHAYRFGAQGTACGGTYPNSTVNLLVLGGDGTVDPAVNGFQIPDGGARLRFRHWYAFENYWDGAQLLWSSSGAHGTFTLVPDSPTAGSPYIASGAYDGILYSGGRGWTGTNAPANGSLVQVEVNLDAVAGQTVWFAWRFSSDSSVTYEGYYLDDVSLEAAGACSTTPVPPGAAVRYRIDGLPSSVPVDVDAPFTVSAVDQYNQVATGYAGSAAFSSSDPAAVLPSSASFTAGVATATIRFRTRGVQSVTATDSAVGSIRGSRATQVVSGPPAALAFLVQPANVQAGNTFSPPVQVALQDAHGNSTDGTVTLAIGNGPAGAQIIGISTAASVNGVATFASASIDKAATGYTLVATAAGAAPAESTAFDVYPSWPATLEFAVQPGTVAAGAAITPPVVVAVRDSYGNPTSGSALVTIELWSSPSGGTLSGTMTASADSGFASFPDLRLDRVGDGYQLRASAPYLASAVSAPFAVVAGEPYRVAFTQQPTEAIEGMPISPPVAAAILDSFDNLATGAALPISLSLFSNPTGATLVGGRTVAAVNGVATFPAVAVDRPGAVYALYAGSSGLFGDESVGFEVLATGAARSFSLSGPAQVEPGVEATLSVTARDGLGVLDAGYAGTATVSTSDPAASVPATVAFAAGVADVHVTFRTAGAQAVTILDVDHPSMTGTVSVTVGGSVTPPPASGGGCGCGSGSADGAAIAGVLLFLGRARRRRELSGGGASRTR